MSLLVQLNSWVFLSGLKHILCLMSNNITCLIVEVLLLVAATRCSTVLCLWSLKLMSVTVMSLWNTWGSSSANPVTQWRAVQLRSLSCTLGLQPAASRMSSSGTLTGRRLTAMCRAVSPRTLVRLMSQPAWHRALEWENMSILTSIGHTCCYIQGLLFHFQGELIRIKNLSSLISSYIFHYIKVIYQTGALSGSPNIDIIWHTRIPLLF